MKELFAKIASKAASQELSMEQAIAELASAKLTGKHWQKLVENLPNYAESPEKASQIIDLLCGWAEAKLEESHRQEAVLWKGWAALLISEFAAANSCFTKTKDYYRKHHPDRLYHCYLLYADGYALIGRFSKALEYYEDALEYAQQDEEKNIDVLCKMAFTQKRLGKLEEAIDFYQRALEILQSIGDDSRNLTIAIAVLESFHHLQQETQKLRKFEQICAFFEKSGDKKCQAVSLSEMAKVIAGQGYKEKAIECLEQARSLVEDQPAFREKSNIFTLLGKLYQEEGKFVEAIQCFELSRQILRESEDTEKTGKPRNDPKAKKSPIKGKKDSSQEQQNPDPEKSDWQPELIAEDEQEIESYKKKLIEARKLHDVEEQGNILHSMGNIYFGLGKLEQAMQCWHESLALAKQQQNMESLYQNYYRLGLLSIKRGDFEGARTALTHGIETLEEMRDYFAAFSPEFIDKHVDIFHQVISCCVKMDNIASALHFLEQLHRWMFMGRIQDKVLLSRSAVSEEVQKEYQQALERLQLIYCNVQDNSSRNVWESTVQATWTNIRQYQEKLEELRTQFEVFDPEWDRLFGKHFRFDPGQLQNSLQAGTVVLQFLPTGEETLVFVVDPEHIDVFSIEELDKKELKQLCEPFELLENFRRLWQDWCIEMRMGTAKTQERLREKLDQFPWKSPDEIHLAWKSTLDHTNQRLADLILPKLLPMLEDAKADRLVIVPCHCFSLFPLHLLILPSPEGTLYLQDGYEIVYAPSATLFLECQNRRPQNNNHLLLAGYPGENLKFFNEELDRLTHIWPGKCSKEFGDKANPENICEKMRKATHVHMGLHTLSTFPDPINSIMYLGDERGEDTFQLRIPHIMSQFSVDAEVVTLAANDREIKYDNIGRGMGPVEAFLYIGAKSVVASLWPLPDLVTFLLMEVFYQGLSQGLPPGMALYEAQNELRTMTVEALYNRLLLQQKVVPGERGEWMKKVCALIEGKSELTGQEKKASLEILHAFRDSVTADIARSGMGLSDFFPEIKGKSPVGDMSDPKARPFEHPFYWGGLICSGMGLTHPLEKDIGMDGGSVSVFVEDLGFLQDEQSTAKDIENALSSLTDEGLKSYESVEKAARENPVIKKSLAKKSKTKKQYFKAACPNCNKKIRCATLPEGGGIARCPQCGKKIRIPPRPSPFDAIKIPAVCPHCAENIHCFLPMAGRRAKCANCKHKVRIPKREILLAEIASSDMSSRIVLLDE